MRKSKNLYMICAAIFLIMGFINLIFSAKLGLLSANEMLKKSDGVNDMNVYYQMIDEYSESYRRWGTVSTALGGGLAGILIYVQLIKEKEE